MGNFHFWKSDKNDGGIVMAKYSRLAQEQVSQKKVKINPLRPSEKKDHLHFLFEMEGITIQCFNIWKTNQQD